MGRFTVSVMEREESLYIRKKTMIIILNSEQLDDFIQKFPDDGGFLV